MLILTRKPGQEIKVNENFTIKVLKINRGQVSLGFKAPKEISINRSEIQDLINKKKDEVNGNV